MKRISILTTKKVRQLSILLVPYLPCDLWSMCSLIFQTRGYAILFGRSRINLKHNFSEWQMLNSRIWDPLPLVACKCSRLDYSSRWNTAAYTTSTCSQEVRVKGMIGTYISSRWHSLWPQVNQNTFHHTDLSTIICSNQLNIYLH